MKVKNITTSEFAELVSAVGKNPTDFKFIGKKPVVVDFYTAWCSYCKTLAPLLDEVYEELSEKVDIYKVDIEEEPIFEQMFNIRTVPTLLFAKEGAEPVLLLGTMNKSQLKEQIEKLLF